MLQNMENLLRHILHGLPPESKKRAKEIDDMTNK